MSRLSWRGPAGRGFLLAALLIAIATASRGADDDLVLVSDSGRTALDVALACPPVLPRGTVLDLPVVFENHGHDTHTVTRGAVAVHLGEWRLSGVSATRLAASVPPAEVVSTSMRIAIPVTARRGSLVTVTVGALGHAGANARRGLLGSASCAIEIATADTPVLAVITIAPATAALAIGTTQSLVARGRFSDGTVQSPLPGVAWFSDSPGVATVDPSTGVARAIAPGVARIRATAGGVRSAPALVTVPRRVPVSLTLSPASAVIGPGGTARFVATQTLSDGTTVDVSNDVTWASTVPGVATVAGGLVTGVAEGTTTITATDAGGRTAIASLSVVAGPITPRLATISPPSGSALGGTLVTIFGANFTPGTSVAIGGAPATDVDVVNAATLTARTPAGAVGAPVDVLLSNADSTVTAPGAFTYLFPFVMPGAVAVTSDTSTAFTVRLIEPAWTGSSATLGASNAALVTVPASVPIAAGSTSIDVPVTAGASTGTTAVTVRIGGHSLTTAVFVTRPFSTVCAGNTDLPPASYCDVQVLASPAGVLTVTPGAPLARVVGVQVPAIPRPTVALATGTSQTVTLRLAAPAANVFCLAIDSSNTSVVTVPAEVCVSIGDSTFSFDATAVAAGTATITATAPGEFHQIDAAVDQRFVHAEALAPPVGVYVAPQAGGPALAPVVGVQVAASPLATALLTQGTPEALTLALGIPAPDGLCVTFTITDPNVATVPETCVAVAAGATSVTFTVTPVARGAATVTATAGAEVIQIGVLVDQTLGTHAEVLARPIGVVVPTQAGGPAVAPVVGVQVAPLLLPTIQLTTPTAHTVTLPLGTPAPAGGLCVALGTSDASVATVPAACVPVAADSTGFSFDVTPVATGTATITATAGGQVIQLSAVVNQSLQAHAETLSPVVGVCVGGAINASGACVR